MVVDSFDSTTFFGFFAAGGWDRDSKPKSSKVPFLGGIQLLYKVGPKSPVISKVH